MNDSLADRCEYSGRQWCSVTHTYFHPHSSARRIRSSSLRSVEYSFSGLCASWPRMFIITKIPNSTGPPESLVCLTKPPTLARRVVTGGRRRADSKHGVVRRDPAQFVVARLGADTTEEH